MTSEATGGRDAVDVFLERVLDFDRDRRRAAQIFVGGRPDDTPAPTDEVAALERTSLRWRALLPDDDADRAALARGLADRFGARLRTCPRTAAAFEPTQVPWEVEALDAGPPTLETALVHVDLAAGSTLFAEGDPADSLYVIARGRVRVLRGDDELVAELGPNQTVGEMGLLTGRTRQASVIAIRDSVLYRLDRADFEQVCLAHPSAMYTMLVSLATRLDAPPPRGHAQSKPTNIVVVPAGRGSPAQAFARRLTEVLASHTSARLVTADAVEQEAGEGAAAAELGTPLARTVMDHLTTLEHRYDHVVFLADDHPTPWSQRCIRQADVVLLVGAAGADPRRNAVEDWLIERSGGTVQATVRLVLVQPHAERTPSGTAPWLDHREVTACHHVHLERDGHFGRLARFMVGEPFGLVLSGGASRALAHIGVLRALDEAGVAIDVVAGTSAGSLIGGQFAMGWNPDMLAERNAAIFGGPRRRILDLTPPFTSLVGSTRFNHALDRVFGDTRFEDLWVRFLCTTTDLTEARTVTHDRGRLRQFVRASCSLPLLMPPVPLRGHLLADGGIMNNTPVDPLLDVTNVGALVVVNVTNPFYSADEAYNYDDSLPLGRIVRSRLGLGDRLVAPGIFDVLMRSLEIGSKSLEPSQIAKADLYVRPEVSRFGYTDVASMSAIIDEGYRATVDSLSAQPLPTLPFT